MDTTNIEKEALERAEVLLGHSPDELKQIRPRLGACESYCFLVTHGGERTFLKIQRNVGAEPVGLYFHERLKQAELPVPDLIALDRGEDRDGRIATLWEYVDGLQANWTGSICPFDEAECGELLRRIHELEYDGPFCFLGDDPPERWFGPSSEHWHLMFPCEEAARDYRDQELLSQAEADVLASLPTRLERELAPVPKRLLHMDFFYNGNLVLSRESGRILAILDYAEAMAGDPLFELAVFERNIDDPHHPVDVDRFMSGYGHTLDRNAPIYRFYTLALLIFERLFDSYALDRRTSRFLDRIKPLIHSFA